MSSWIYFLLSVSGLALGYYGYGRIIEHVFGADANLRTPVCTLVDGVDYVEMTPGRMFLIQLMNIAGPGPVLGPVLGTLYGPVALIWIVIGSVFAGAVHDYFSGMLSLRCMGKSLPDVVGATLGTFCRRVMTVFSLILLLLVGVVFVSGPAGLLSSLTGMDVTLLTYMIFAWYFCAVLLPVDRFIGRLYPFFALILILLAFGLLGALFVQEYPLYSGISACAVDNEELPWWPMVCITIACGACSGFHATQSPIMARCLSNELYGRRVFYGAMIAEGVLSLIWATLGMSLYPDVAALRTAMGPDGNAVLAVNDMAVTLLGAWGGTFALIGVVILPITTGDTALRAVRLMLADTLKLDQRPLANRLKIVVPLCALALGLTRVPFDRLWNCFGLSNQLMACMMLWTAAVWLIRRGRCHWVASGPAVFMTTVCGSTLLVDTTYGISLPETVATAFGLSLAVLCLGLLLGPGRRSRGEEVAKQ